MKALKDLQKEIQNLKHKRYYVVECPKCHEKFVVEFSEFERIMFEPYEKPFESYSVLTFEPQTIIETVSSDPSKDIYKVKINCNCGVEEISLSHNEFSTLKKVKWDGTNNIQFELTEVESEKARAFMEKHNHSCVTKQNLTLGEYYSYNIMPTGLGNAVSIECNLCKESENLTDCKDW